MSSYKVVLSWHFVFIRNLVPRGGKERTLGTRLIYPLVIETLLLLQNPVEEDNKLSFIEAILVPQATPKTNLDFHLLMHHCICTKGSFV